MNPADRVFTLRAILIGLAGVCFICGLTPFNNFVLANTFLVGNLLPVGLLLFLSVVVLLLNGMLLRLRRAAALSTGELCVVLTMTLVSCTLPSSGLMRFLPPHLVGLYAEAQTNANAARAVDAARLNDALFPNFEHTDSARRGGEMVVREYLGRSIDRVTPWSKWVRPALIWGALVACLYGAMAFLLVLVRRQWQDNERIAFPLADVYQTLLEPAEPGRAMPPVFCSRLFWGAAGAVFVIHLLAGLAQWFPKVPSFSVGYNFNGIFSDPPMNHATYGFKAAKIVFAVVGISYFINLRVSLSIIFFFLLYNAFQIVFTPSGYNLTEGMQRDQTLGAIATVAVMMLYIGRAHWALILRNMVGRRREDDASGDAFGSYALAGWCFVLCTVGAMYWFYFAGAGMGLSAVIVIGILGFWIVMARLVAESGLIYAQLHNAPFGRLMTLLTTDLPLPRPTPRGFLAASLASSLFVTDQRESMAVYTSSSLVATSRAKPNHQMRALLGVIGLALTVGFLVSGASTLWCEYNFDVTLGLDAQTPLNAAGVLNHPKWYVLNPLYDFLSPAGGPRETHARLTHVGLGATLTAVVSVMYLRLPWFPLHPIGALMAYSFPVQNSWLGIFCGWALKSLMTHFGGARLYSAAKPFFIGLIFGETAAVALWLCINLILAMLGIDYRAIVVQLP